MTEEERRLAERMVRLQNAMSVKLMMENYEAMDVKEKLLADLVKERHEAGDFFTSSALITVGSLVSEVGPRGFWSMMESLHDQVVAEKAERARIVESN